MKLLRCVMLLSASLCVTGCHCLPCVENHNSRIDNIADMNFGLDGSAFSRLDVTRIGKPDGPNWARCNCNTCR